MIPLCPPRGTSACSVLPDDPVSAPKARGRKRSHSLSQQQKTVFGGRQLDWPWTNQAKNKEGQGRFQYNFAALTAVGIWHRVAPCVWWMN